MTCPMGFDCQSIVGMVHPCPNIAVCMGCASSSVSDQDLVHMQFDATDVDIHLIDSNQNTRRPQIYTITDPYTRMITRSGLI